MPIWLPSRGAISQEPSPRWPMMWIDGRRLRTPGTIWFRPVFPTHQSEDEEKAVFRRTCPKSSSGPAHQAVHTAAWHPPPPYPHAARSPSGTLRHVFCRIARTLLYNARKPSRKDPRPNRDRSRSNRSPKPTSTASSVGFQPRGFCSNGPVRDSPGLWTATSCPGILLPALVTSQHCALSRCSMQPRPT